MSNLLFSCGMQHFLIVMPKVPLLKHAYSNILKILQPRKENFQIKNSDIFHIPAQNIDCGYLLEVCLSEVVLTNTHTIYGFF